MQRIHRNRAREHLVNTLLAAAQVASIPEDWEDMVVARLKSGEQLVAYIVDRTISLDMVARTLATNQRDGLYTLYVLWGVMFLPDEGVVYEAEDWMAALAAAYGGKIYGYWVAGAVAEIRPVYFGGATIQYGADIHAAGLRVYVNGVGQWVADFSAGVAGPALVAEPDSPQAVLGVAQDADWETIKTAYRRLAQQYHPDVNDSAEAVARMQAINAAYHALSKLQ